MVQSMKIKLQLLREGECETFLEDVHYYKTCLPTFLFNRLLIISNQLDNFIDDVRVDKD